MCNAERKKRGFTPDGRCAICGAESEDVEHTIRSCPAAEIVWKSINLAQNQGMSSPMDFDNWLTTNLAGTTDGQRSKRRSARFAITMWWIWKWRNKYVFEGVGSDIREKVGELQRHFKEIELVLERSAGPATGHNTFPGETNLGSRRRKAGLKSISTEV